MLGRDAVVANDHRSESLRSTTDNRPSDVKQSHNQLLLDAGDGACVLPETGNLKAVQVFEIQQQNDRLLVSTRGIADLGHQVPEAGQEGVDLGLDGCGHAVPCHQVHILPLVLLCHPAVPYSHSQLLWSMMYNVMPERESMAPA